MGFFRGWGSVFGSEQPHPNKTKSFLILLKLVIFIVLNLDCIKAELTPPYFNLATGRKIYATATCGVGVDEPELFCKLVGANTENDNNFFSVIQGQVCDTCDPSRPDKNHPPEYAIDGTEAWWQSPPLSRGMKYNEVNLTIDFGQEFHVAYVFIRMANSPRPGLWTLEKSTDYGKTWTPWQHFSDTPADCEIYFGRNSLKQITRDDDVICDTQYSKIVPLENGEIPVMLLNNRPSANNYFNSTVLQEWTRATNVRIRLLRTKNLLGHLMSVARQDPTVTRRYFYSIKDISIGGRCMCNGHADTCDVLDPASPVRILACRCQHHTCGIQCNECCPGFEQKKWRQNTNARPFRCEPCNCFGHSNRCVYDEEVDDKGLSLDIHGNYEGGGVCQDCQHNTAGINCNKCQPKFYRPWGKNWNETDVCRPCDCNKFYSTGNCEEETGRCECRPEYQQPDCQSCAYGYFGFPQCRECECNLNGTDGYHCQVGADGKCPCKANFGGNYCKQCAPGYFNYPICEPCNCNSEGTVKNDCDPVSGQCLCKSNFGGKNCENCKDSYYLYPSCLYCDCDNQGTLPEVCDKESGGCLCREGYTGVRCNQCAPGYYNYPNCIPCNCSLEGSRAVTCDAVGKCDCLPNFAGKQCNSCSAGNYKYPDCISCNCSTYGSQGVSCNSEGQCSCLPNFDGKLCDVCKKGFYNHPTCEECNCDPAGLIPRFGGCGSVPAGELCQCKERVTGRICNQCKPLFWNLTISNPEGCESCNCHLDGTISSLETCDTKSGQCVCKPSTQGRQCNQCEDGTYELEGASLFGCKDCNCDIGGSINLVCDKVNGQCPCHQRITGRTCSQPLTTHYFPTLYQFQFEYEDGYTPSGAHVRYQYNENSFPEFSGKGYAVFSNIQNEVINEVNIFKSSVYRMVIRYHNPTEANVTASILITSDNPLELDQTARVLFKPTSHPQFVTVAGAKGDIPSPIVLDPGRYTFSIKTDKNILLDYFVLLPAAYYEASILTRKIETPCVLGNLKLCRHYKYPSLDEYKPVNKPFIDGIQIFNTMEVYDDQEHLNLVSYPDSVPVLTLSTQSLKYPLIVSRSGYYVIVIDYISHRDYANSLYYAKVQISTQPPLDNPDFGSVALYPCLYSMICRQPVIDDVSREKIFFINEVNQFPFEISFDDSDDHKIPIVSITAIPIEEWSVDFIQPRSVCVVKDSECVPSVFRIAAGSKKVELEHGHEVRISSTKPAYTKEDDSVKLIYLSHHNPTIEIQSKVSEPGRYVIIIQYYQPYHPKFQVLFRLATSKQIYDGKFDVNHCPSSSGCRGIIRPEDENMWFDIDKEFNITFTNNRQRGVWLDYFLLVPVNQYYDDLLEEETFDQTKEFIQKCGQDHFHIQLNASEYCKKAVFSLTADYNGGALQCNCDYDGSHSFECDPFGGQCQCKPNVIGRRCEACRTGYWGFPDCKHCDCPLTALCEKDTGKCICPPHVVGEKCDQCEPYTYGFHQIIGCEECNCNELGVKNYNRQCDLNNGTCQCKENIEGRTCDQCSNGYFNFPMCDECRCNKNGTSFEVCDKLDGTCFCKKNVVGGLCNRCQDGTYNLQASNPEGCTKCFCFDKSQRCESAFLRVFNVSLLKNVSVNTVHIDSNSISFEMWADLLPNKILINETTLQADFQDYSDNDADLVYFGVLDYFASQNNHLTAYGGYLVYTLYYTTGPFGKLLYAPDVILYGKDTVLIHESYEQPSSQLHFKKSLQMVETNFQTLDKKPVSKADFMMVLRDLHMIYIRANYKEQTVLSQLSDVYLTLGAEDEENYHLYQLLPVESCECPPGYTGLSCENCAQGYFRVSDGPYGGYCAPCQCHGHADTCDCNTGKCTNCMHNTTGDHCEICIEGYHGNATYGTPYDCMICACPLPYDSNNFAKSCEISETGREIHCECKPGYTGAQCESCAAGYYGQPRQVGDYCKPCECSGNIDPSIPGSCDTITGECLMCLNNTYGKACNLCAPGYYGDAIKLKDCKSCHCKEIGTAYCNSTTGTCVCHENVIGEECDRCKPDHYGHVSGLGCRPCDCGLASYSSQCNDDTGACLCKPGVTGRQCDRCAVDHWNYTVDGCIPCLCNKGFSRGFGCNALTGQCECLPGVIGEKCDACPHRWVLEQDRGCSICDDCQHALLNATDDLYTMLNPIFHEFQSVAHAHFTLLKLENYNSTALKLLPEVRQLDSNKINLVPSRNNVLQLESEVKNLTKFISYAEQGSKDNAMKSDKILKDALDVLDLSRFAGITARNTIKEVKNLAHSFDTSVNTITENATKEAEAILEKLLAESIDLRPVENAMKNSLEFTNEIDNFILPVKRQTNALDHLKNNISEFEDKLNDLKNWSTIAIENSFVVNQMNQMNKKSFDAAKFDTVANQTVEIDRNNDETKKLAFNGNSTCNAIDQRLYGLMQTFDVLKNDNMNAEKLLPLLDTEHIILKNRIDNEAYPHALRLEEIANNLVDQYANIKENSETAVLAANSYSYIHDTVMDARKNVTEAKEAIGNATELAKGLEGKAGASHENSAALLNDAHRILNKVLIELKPRLNKSTEIVDILSNSQNNSNAKLLEINKLLEQLPETSQQSSLWNNANDAAETALFDARKTVDLLKPVIKDIDLDSEKAKNISKHVDTTDKDIVQIRNQVNRVIGATPNLKNFTDSLEKYQHNVAVISNDLRSKIEDTKRQIEMARNIANRIKVGVTFNEKTVLELKTPETVPLLESKSKVSLYFNTSNPNGFLMYLGNDNKTESHPGRDPDFMAIEIENGYPVLTIDLGKGPERINSKKYVADGRWYQAVVDRTGDNVQFIIREQIEDGKEKYIRQHVEEKSLLGNIFSVDKNSRLFVGGYPPDFIPPEDITKSSFQGQIEGLKIGDEEVGLWNFIDAENNYEGAMGRNTFLAEDQQSTGYRFNGNGFVSISASPYSFTKRSRIVFKFKASRESKDGLMFYSGKNNHFIAIELINGGVRYQYQMGQHLVQMQTESDKAFNDDAWHTVEAERDGRKGKLRVDDKLIYQEEAPLGAEENLRIDDLLYFGGVKDYLRPPQVVNRNFDGCIDNVTISGTTVDLTNNKEALAVRPGCPDKFTTILSFPPEQYGYLKKPNIYSYNSFQVHLEFRTLQNEGVIFYAANYNQSSTIGLTIHDGSLRLRSGGVEVSSSGYGYNDGQQHIVTASHDGSRLRLSIDDKEDKISYSPPFLYIAPGDIYFGGLPMNFRPPKNALSTLAYFIGCISQVTINGQIVNFANTTEKMSGYLDTCPPEMFNYDPSRVQIHYPGETLETHIIPDQTYRPIEIPAAIPEYTTTPPYLPEEVTVTDAPSTITQRRPPTTKPIPKVKPTVPTQKPRPITKPPKKDDEQCALPIDPQYDEEFTSGFRFGTKQQSRLEVAMKVHKRYDITFEFKTNQDDGILFYASDAQHIDFFALYMRHGHLHHILRCGTEVVNLISEGTYYDNVWHQVQFARNNSITRLVIDEKLEYISEPRCPKQMNIQSPTYFGGIGPGTQSKNITQEVINNIKFESATYYGGCIRNINIGGKGLTTYSPYNVISCSDDAETGVFFGHNEDSYVKLHQNFTVGTELTITFEMRPRVENGLIMSVHGSKTNYLMLQLYNGSLYFNVMTAGQELEVKFSLANESFCDGQWRKVQAIKSLYVITLAVNDISATPAIGNATKINTATWRPLFLGGHQFLRRENRVPGIKVRKPYYGCIRNIKIGDSIQQVTPQMAHGDVWTGVCPIY